MGDVDDARLPPEPSSGWSTGADQWLKVLVEVQQHVARAGPVADDVAQALAEEAQRLIGGYVVVTLLASRVLRWSPRTTVLALVCSIPPLATVWFERLATRNDRLPRQQAVPAYVVMYDTSLEEICQRQPSTIPELLRITGFGQRKAQMYGAQIFRALERFRNGARASAAPKQISRPAAATKRLLDEGQGFLEIAAIRGRQVSTVINSVAVLIESGEVEFRPGWVEASRRAEIEAACARLGTAGLRPIKEAVSAEITYDDIRLIVARIRWEEKRQKATGT